jgi:hypothetical protein
MAAQGAPEPAGPGVIADAPVFYPTDEEFRDPLLYIASIRAVAEKSGARAAGARRGPRNGPAWTAVCRHLPRGAAAVVATDLRHHLQQGQVFHEGNGTPRRATPPSRVSHTNGRAPVAAVSDCQPALPARRRNREEPLRL